MKRYGWQNENGTTKYYTSEGKYVTGEQVIGGVKYNFANDAKVMSKGQVTIPKNVRAALGVDTGDRVTFIVDVTPGLKNIS